MLRRDPGDRSSTRRLGRRLVMRIELLYFDGCPSYERLLPRLRELVADAGVTDEVELRRVDSPESAVAAARPRR